jgi:hypothetical protein
MLRVLTFKLGLRFLPICQTVTPPPGKNCIIYISAFLAEIAINDVCTGDWPILFWEWQNFSIALETVEILMFVIFILLEALHLLTEPPLCHVAREGRKVD